MTATMELIKLEERLAKAESLVKKSVKSGIVKAKAENYKAARDYMDLADLYQKQVQSIKHDIYTLAINTCS